MDHKYEKPTSYTLLYWLILDKRIEPETFFDFLELFWPTFVEKDGHVFLKEKFSEAALSQLIAQKTNPEYWINLLTVDDFFAENDDGEEQAEALAKALVEIWKAKLEKDFPAMQFTVKYLWDNEFGDHGVTFYQSYISDDTLLKR